MFKQEINYVFVLFSVALLSACGGGGSDSGGGGGSPATNNANHFLMILTQNPNGNSDLSTFGYTSTGTVPNASPVGTLTIPAIPPTTGSNSGCGGLEKNNSLMGYDNTNHLLFLSFTVANTSMTICSYKADMTTGALSFVSAKTEIEVDTSHGGFIDTLNHAITFIGASFGTSVVYPYNPDGTIDTTTAYTFNGFANVPSPYTLLDGDFINHWAWYGTSGSNGANTIYGVCGISYAASSRSGYTIGTCSQFGLSIAMPGKIGMDTANGLFFTTTQVPNLCTTTPTMASVYTYPTSTGIIDPNPKATSDLGNCTYNAYNPNARGPETGSVDLTDHIFFSVTNVSGMKITPITYMTSPFALSGSLTPAPENHPSAGGVTLDLVNHLVFLVTTTNGSITGVDAYPYTGSGLGSIVSSAITPTNATPVNNSGVLFAFIY